MRAHNHHRQRGTRISVERALEHVFVSFVPDDVVVRGMAEPQTASKDMGRGFGWQALFWVASFP
jgi:hypothetical protein